MADKPIKDVRASITFRNNKLDDIGESTGVPYANTTQSRAYTLKDYKWTERNYDANQPANKLIITEFQPERTFSFGEVLSKISAAANIGNGIVNNVAGQALAQAFKTDSQQSLIDKYSGDASSNLTKLDSTSMKLISNMMKGQYLNTYEIPYHDTTYFNANFEDSWSAAGMENIMGSELAQIVQNNSNINFPMPAQWSNSGNGIGMQFTPVEFYLINDTLEDLTKNFRFLHAFAAGTFWIQADFSQLSPNLYDIECPGRFHRNWVAMGINVTQEGKLRTNDYFQALISQDFSGINAQTLFPEAYKVTVTFKDLTPNSYNCWASYLLNGTNNSVTIGGATEGSNKLIADIALKTIPSIEQSSQKIKQTAENMGKTINSGLTTAVNSLVPQPPVPGENE